jgi:uncharacterized protein with HEPN domain
MASRSVFRVRDVKQSILSIRQLLAGRSFDSMYDDVVVRAAFERFLEILSEASRSIPDEWKQKHGLPFLGGRSPTSATSCGTPTTAPTPGCSEKST